MAQYRNRTELATELTAQGLKLPLSENIQVLQKPLLLRGKSLANRIAVQPMEGCDGTADGKPGELTLRRYDRFASGGAGLLWFEAVAVMEEGRANPRQLMITENSLDSLKRVTARIKEIGMRENGYEPLIIMQATHSGRYSKPQGTPSPIIASNNPLIEKDTPLPPSCIITDDHIREIVECFGSAAKMAERAGFDGIDIKSCHGYLGCELLSAYQRSGAYGGSFENRTRFLREGIANATASTTSNFLVTSRLNIYDGLPYPHGFGVTPQGNDAPDLTEPARLIAILQEKLGVQLLNLTLGNPYFTPHLNRPADRTPDHSDELPLAGVARMVDCVGQMQKMFPKLAIVGSGLSYLRGLTPMLAAGGVEQGLFSVAGFGRLSIAYPDFPKRMLAGETMLDSKACCLSCGSCSQLMRLGCQSGCAVHDSYYTELLRNAAAGQKGGLIL